MDDITVIDVGSQALFVVLKTSGPIMLSGLVIGLIISLFQALTSIQEMTLTFVPKNMVIFFSIVIFLPFMITTVVEFGRSVFSRIIGLG
ncbi:MAG: flagellar biosynthesis protein FliQ [Rhodospirillales bacterium]|jgi:flagellar biosynthetic protein FliQ|nr:flagellar biosynthesis protein FliQ [Rhodospirillales bacterium]MDP6883292.1 flagellar biosynthesis protein FliQ [Rhodospirillales bacterium]|tara:strand:+ start:480 stop:746 length:267 start_codon:yes stop_codon:yes gene_type:complete